MASEIKMRSLGKMKSVDVLEVKVAVGDVVTKGQPLLEIESEKGTADFPSPSAGRITQILVKPEDKVTSGQVLFLIESGETDSAKGPASKQPPTPKTAPAPPPPPRMAPETAEPSKVKGDGAPRPTPAPPPVKDRSERDGLLVRAGPATRKLARKLGGDLAQVRGSRKD